MRKQGILDKAAKMFPEGAIARAANEAGTAGKLLKMSKTAAKPLCKVLGRVAGPLAVIGAVQDAQGIGTTAVTGVQAASAVNNAVNSSIDTQNKENNHLNSDDDLTDDEITHYMGLRVGGSGK